MNLLWLYGLLFIVSQVYSANILAFLPLPAKSHQRVFHPIIKELVNKGHNVTSVNPFQIQYKPSSNAVPGGKLNQIIIPDYFPEFQKAIGEKGNPVEMQKWMKWPVISIVFMIEFANVIQSNLMTDSQVQQIFNSTDKYDLLLLESFFLQEAYWALGHKFNAPIIELLPTGNFHWCYWIVGNPYDPSYIIDGFTSYTDTMNFYERFSNTAMSLFLRGYFYWYGMKLQEEFANKYIKYNGSENRPKLIEIGSKVSLALINQHLSLSYPYPSAPHVKDIGGIHIEPTKPLPSDLKKFMDESKDGIIYMSFGSTINVSSALAGEFKEYFLKGFSKMKQRILWKWEEEFNDLPNNIYISKWFPQQDILAHQNCKAFISHAGFLSTSESIYNGVPLIVIPFLGDQNRNAKKITSSGCGIELSLENITEKSVTWALNEIVNNPSYKNEALKHKNIFRDQPFTPLEQAMYWIEYVIKYEGASHLRPAAATMKWYQLAQIDVAFAFFVIFVLVITATILFMKYLYKLCFGSKTVTGTNIIRKKKQ